MLSKDVQQRLALALAIAEDPTTVYCVHPFASVQDDGGEHLGKLLARVMTEPDRSLLVATDKAFIFAFGNHTRPDQSLQPENETSTPNLPSEP
jgi:ABC-type lipoprotein export system ATPase subunit